jgi:multidrug efflux pump subunit AcrA (membrane-fusion protein)
MKLVPQRGTTIGALALIGLLLVGARAFAPGSSEPMWGGARDAEAAETETAGASASVLTVRPRREDVARVVRMTGELRPWRTALVHSAVAGYAASDPVEIGTRVTQGTTVLLEVAAPDLVALRATADQRVAAAAATTLRAQADASEAQAARASAEALHQRAVARVGEMQAAVAEAEAKLGVAQAEMTWRTRAYDRLVAAREGSPGMVSQDRVDEAEGARDVARAQAEAARAAIDGARRHVAGAQAEVGTAQAAMAAAEARIAAEAAGVEGARAGEAVAAAQATEARVAVEMARLVAPIDGVVTERNADRGQLVNDARRSSGAMPLFRIVDDRRLRLSFFVTAPDVPHVAVGRHVELRFEEFPDWPAIRLTVARTGGALDPSTRTLEVEADLWNIQADEGNVRRVAREAPLDEVLEVDEPQGDGPFLLRADMFGRVRVELETHHDALVVPERCVTTRKQASSVLVVDGTGHIRKRIVQIGQGDGLRIRLLGDDIQEGDRLVYRGSQMVSEGERVEATDYEGAW